MTVGVYVIVHEGTGRTYVGQSINIEKRQRQHIHGLESGLHHNQWLQKDWDDSSKNPYVFKVVYKLNHPHRYNDEELKDILDLLEWKFLEDYGEETETYNIAGVRKPPPSNIPQEIIDTLFDGEVWVLPEYRRTVRTRETHYDDYLKLLNKYRVRRPMEKWSTESYAKESREYRIRKYVHDSRVIMDRMKLVGYQRAWLKKMIRTIPLKELHRTLNYEKIIICLCIYIRKVDDGRNFRWQEYGIVKEYGLTMSEVLTTITNLCAYYSRKIPLPMVSEQEVLENYHERSQILDDDVQEYVFELMKEAKHWKERCRELESQLDQTMK